MLSKIFSRMFPWRKIRPEPAADEQVSDGPQIYTVDEFYPCVSDPSLPFSTLTPIQSCFYDHYNPNRNCIVNAPTGTGKSGVIYIAARKFLNIGQRVILTAPTKALVKQLYESCIGIFGSKLVGINTGRDKNTAGKFIIVTTPESFLSAYRSGKEWTPAGLLIVDEGDGLFDVKRGPELDVVMTVCKTAGMKILTLSATYQGREKELARFFYADLFDARYRRTKIISNEDSKQFPPTIQDDFNALLTAKGYIYNKNSLRLLSLERILEHHADDSILIFVTTKEIGNALSAHLSAPFHNADIGDENKAKMEFEFNTGICKLMIATGTLSRGVETPCDVVIQFGTRAEGNYQDASMVRQNAGRAGRGKDEARFYILGDDIELFHAKNYIATQSAPVPVESMVLTVLATRTASEGELVDAISRTFAASFIDERKIRAQVTRYLTDLKGCGRQILTESQGAYVLTKEGLLLARYYIYPQDYIRYVTLAEDLKAATPIPNDLKGFYLMALLFPGVKDKECPSRLALDFQIKLKDAQVMFPDSQLSAEVVSPQKAALYHHFTKKPAEMPDFVPFKLRDAERWIGMLKDMQKHGVYKEPPGLLYLLSAVSELNTAAMRKKQKAAKQVPKTGDLFRKEDGGESGGSVVQLKPAA